jgi:hypothetical protein
MLIQKRFVRTKFVLHLYLEHVYKGVLEHVYKGVLEHVYKGVLEHVYKGVLEHKNMLFVVSVKGEIKAARKLFYTMYEVQAYKTH